MAALEGRLGAQRTDRRRCHTAQADPSPRHGAVDHVEGEGDGDAGDVVEAAFGDLVERGEPGEWQGDPNLADEFVRTAEGLAVAGEVVRQRHDPLATGAGQHEAGFERQQRCRGVADGRRGAEVAAESGTTSDEG